MAETPHGPDIHEIPEAVAVPKSRRSLQLVWIIPIVAALVGGWLAVKTLLEKGPEITISFRTAEGLEAGKTKIKFKDVDIGMVKSVTFSKDLSHVIATADLVKEAEPYLVEDTRFWVVRPRISGGTVSGLGTLFGGTYIGTDIGKSKTRKRDFIGLEEPPVISTDIPGREFILHADTLGSLDAGVPIFFRRLQVGQVTSYALDKDGKGVTLKIFIDAPYDQYVNPNTRFWNASGIDVTVDASGIRVNSEGLVSIAIGGIAFQTLATDFPLPPAEADTEFELFSDRTEALKHKDTLYTDLIVVFRESVRGLSVGAPVDFYGITIGEVTAIKTQFDPKTFDFSIPVEIRIYPERLTSRYLKGPARGRVSGKEDPKKFMEGLVNHGFRAQLRTGNLLTGQLYVALDFFPDAPKAKFDMSQEPPEIPTVPSGLQAMQKTITVLADKLTKIAGDLQKVPFGQIGQDVRVTMQSANHVMKRLDEEITPQARDALIDLRKSLDSANQLMSERAPLQQDTREAMRELARTARALRVLADYLERHPEALIRGKQEDKK
ncbi:MAG TPA: MlaD family protein [Burkholderiales bacterium]|nr:MlaD family protein [Burkholderiales bacterium]